MNLYVIDDASRDPISGAEVRVGTVSGTTDATGLFVAEGVTGAQDVVVVAPAHRKEFWVGANGANMTVNLEVDNTGAPASATVTGSIPNLVTSPLPANVVRIGIVQYSQSDDTGDPANELPQAVVNNLPQNICVAVATTDPCTFTISARVGKLALVALVIDIDNKGTPADTDDTQTFVGWAVRQGITTTAGGTVTGQTLSLIPAGMQQTITTSFGSPPASLGMRAAVVGLEIGDEGILPLTTVTPAGPSFQGPTLAGVSGATAYRLIGFATDGATTDTKQSIVIRHGLAGPTLEAGTWLAPPTGVTISKASATWTNVEGATVHGIEIKQGATAILNVTVVDNTKTAITIPSEIVLPSGSLSAEVTGIGATGLDINDFELDRDRDKLDRVAGQAKTLN
ncbi:MAG: hypothetical protein ABI867_03990 [Kofleriaceae bacterium]